MYKIIIFLCTFLLAHFTKAETSKTFPNSFSFGTGSSAYQIEGSWNIDGKSENIWDHWIHSDPTRIKYNATADVACDSYKYPILDAIYAHRLGVQHYHFSIPWTRILPSGFADQINMKAILYYQTFIEQLRRYHITPVVSLYYHDLPQSLQDIGGWENPDMVKYFADYARICFQFFHNVTTWITFNDPRATCRYGYGDGSYAPGIASDGNGEYVCAQTILKAHAAAYHLYKDEFKDLSGKVSIALDLRWSEPAIYNGTAAVQRRNAFEFGLYANPICKGNWPNEVIERVDYRSKHENFTESRLPKFTEEEINYINGTSDFIAVNIFYAHVVEDVEEAEFGDPSYEKDMKVKLYMNPKWDLAVNGQPIVPSCARASLVWLKSQYNDPEILITGNGMPDKSITVDIDRISYLRNYLSAIFDAINRDEVKIFGYTAWSLYDSFEWTDGYSYKFGIYFVDASDPCYQGAKSSVEYYKKITETFTIPEEDPTTVLPLPLALPPALPPPQFYQIILLVRLQSYLHVLGLQ